MARANCEPLDKRLLIYHFLNRRRPKIFGRNVFTKFFDKRFVFNVFTSHSYTFKIILCPFQTAILVFFIFPRVAKMFLVCPND